MSFLEARTDAQQGAGYRISFLHVPAARRAIQSPSKLSQVYVSRYSNTGVLRSSNCASASRGNLGTRLPKFSRRARMEV